MRLRIIGEDLGPLTIQPLRFAEAVLFLTKYR